MSEDEEMASHEAFQEYSEAMDQVERRCSYRHAHALRAMVIYGEALPQERSWMVGEALDFLSGWWRIR